MPKPQKTKAHKSRRSERRRTPAPSDKALYQHPDLTHLVQHERRQDMLSRLREVQEQKRLWLLVVAICLGLNLTLVGLGVWGWLNP